MTDSWPRPVSAQPDLSLPRLYTIVDVDLCRIRSVDPVRFAASCVAGGCRLLQLRQKSSGSGSMLAVTRQLLALVKSVGGRVIVNDRADIAAMAGADGVHVGQDDLAPSVVRSIAPRDLVIGLSTHTRHQIDEALADRVDYIAVGPVFRTRTKETGYDPRGLEMVSYAARGGKPIVAIGGITIDNAARVVGAGATSVAVVSDLLADADPESRVRRYIELLADA